MSTTTAAETETLIEYGYRQVPTDATEWPDEDGDLEIGDDYYDAVAITPTQLDRLKAAASRDGGQLYERTVTKGAERRVAPDLPTAKGSVVRATVRDGRGGTVERVFFSYGEADVWVSDCPIRPYVNTASASDLTVLEVLRDAAA